MRGERQSYFGAAEAGGGFPGAQIRNPGAEIRRRSEGRNPNGWWRHVLFNSCFGFRISFGFRFSDFGFRPQILSAAFDPAAFGATVQNEALTAQTDFGLISAPLTGKFMYAVLET
jgi:hypothetical protein